MTSRPPADLHGQGDQLLAMAAALRLPVKLRHQRV